MTIRLVGLTRGGVFCAMLGAAAPLLAQPPAERAGPTTAAVNVEFAPMVITGTAGGSDAFHTPADIAVVAGEEKTRQQTPGLGGTLDALPGVSSIGAGQQVSKPVLRGLSGNRVRVLNNGIGLDFQQFGVRHPPNLDPYVAERIEVVRGATSILYGSDAIGGAINILPVLPPAAPNGEQRAAGSVTLGYAGAFRQGYGAASATAANGPLGIAARFIGRYSDGLRVPAEATALESGKPSDPLATGKVPFTDYRQFSGDINLGYATADGQVVLRWEAYRNQQNFLVPDPPNTPEETALQAGGIGQKLHNDIVQIDGDWQLTPAWNLQPNFTYMRNLRVANPGGLEPQPREALPAAAVVDIRRDQWTARLDMLHAPPVQSHQRRLGIELMLADQDSRGTTAITPGGRIGNVALFGLEEREYGPLTVNLGGRLDYRYVQAIAGKTLDQSGLPADGDQRRQEYWVPTGAIGLIYRLTESLALASNLARGFRAPTLFELYVDGVHGGVAAVQQGDPGLDAETSWNLDASLRWQSPRLQFQLTGYAYRLDDYIFLQDTGQTDSASGLSIFTAAADDAELYGADVSATLRPAPWLSLTGTAEYVDGELDDGRTVPLLPPLQLDGEVRLTPSRLGMLQAPYLGLGVHYADAQNAAGPHEPFSQFDQPPPPFGTASTAAYTLFNLTAGAKFGDTEMRLAVDNLFDRAYRDFLDTYKIVTLGPGRNIRLDLTQRF